MAWGARAMTSKTFGASIALLTAMTSGVANANGNPNGNESGVPEVSETLPVIDTSQRLGHIIVRDPLIVQDNLNTIINKCRISTKTCTTAFPSYYRENNEHSSSGGFLGLFKSQSFWGAGQELHYTQVPATATDIHGTKRTVEYQVGFGYIVAARQVDADMKGKGFLDSTPVSIKGKGGGTRFWAMLIGLAPDKLSSTNSAITDALGCDDEDLDAQSALVCTLDMQPTVTQRYYRDTSSRLANAMNDFRRSYSKLQPDPAVDAKSLICPQVIDFRWKEPEKGTRNFGRQDVNDETWANLVDAADYINRKLTAACVNNRPNVKVAYRDGAATRQWDKDAPAPSGSASTRSTLVTQSLVGDTAEPVGSGSIGIGDGSISYDRNSITQEYQRNRYYLSTSSKRSPRFDRKLIDHRFDIRMEGLNKSAKLPSILASIVNYEQEDISQHLSLKLICSGGTYHVAVPENPVANPTAYTQLVSNARRVVDSPVHDCNQVSNTPSSR